MYLSRRIRAGRCPRLAGGQVGADDVTVAGQAVDALLDPVRLAQQQARGLRGQAVGWTWISSGLFR